MIMAVTTKRTRCHPTLLSSSKKKWYVTYLSIVDTLSEAGTCDDEAQHCEDHEVIKPNYINKWFKPDDAAVYDSQICRVYRVGSLQEAIDKHSNFFDDFNSSWFQERTPQGFKLLVRNLKKFAFQTRDFEFSKMPVIAERISENEDLDEE